MTSKTSCFDSAIFKRSLRKTLPLWACYFLFWLFILPGDLISFNYQPEYYDSLTGRLCERILTFCTVGTLLSALIGLIAAWLLFSWLFRANTSYFYAGLPVRREGTCAHGRLGNRRKRFRDRPGDPEYRSAFLQGGIDGGKE